MIIYLIPPLTSGGTPSEFSFAVMRRYPRIKRTGCPPSVLSCTARGFSCLAHYSASGQLLLRLFTLACASFKVPARSFLVHFTAAQFFSCDVHVFYVPYVFLV